MNRILGALCLVLGAAAPSATQAQIEWNTDWPATFAKAKTEHRLVLVEVRSPSCVTCDAMEQSTWSDPVIGDMLQSYLLLRVDAATSTKMGPYAIGSFRGVVIFDPGEQPRFRFAGFQPPDVFARHLQSAGAAAKMIVEASSALEAGQTVEAHMMLGKAYGAAQQTDASIRAFAAAAAEAAARGDETMQRTAEIYGSLAWIEVKPDEGLKHLRAVRPSEIDEVEYIREMAFMMLHMKRGDRKSAVRAAQRAAKHCPDEMKKQCDAMANELALASRAARTPGTPSFTTSERQSPELRDTTRP